MNQFNFIPQEIKQERKNRVNKRIMALVVFCILWTVALALYLPEIYVSKLENKKNEIIESLNTREAIDAGIDESDREAVIIMDYLKVKSILLDNKKELYKGISEIMHKSQSGISIESVDYSGGSLQVTGSSNNYNSICRYVEELGKINEFKEAKLLNIKCGLNPNVYNFVIKLY